MIRPKFLLFKYYGVITAAVLVLVIILIYLKGNTVDWKIVVTLISVAFSFTYFVQKQKLEEMKLFKELYGEFNARYDDLNESLNRILRDKSGKKLEPDELDILYNYFNLCGEEYFYYRQGYIYPKVWKAWRNGMKIFYANERIRKTWADELKNDSYYGFQLSELEKG